MPPNFRFILPDHKIYDCYNQTNDSKVCYPNAGTMLNDNKIMFNILTSTDPGGSQIVIGNDCCYYQYNCSKSVNSDTYTCQRPDVKTNELDGNYLLFAVAMLMIIVLAASLLFVELYDPIDIKRETTNREAVIQRRFQVIGSVMLITVFVLIVAYVLIILS